MFLRLGSTLLLASCLLSLKYVYRIFKNLRYGLRGLKNGYKLIIGILLLILLFYCWLNYENHFYEIEDTFSKINFSYFNPLSTTLSEISKLLNEKEIKAGNTFSQNNISKITKPKVNISQLERRIHELVNEERKKYGLQPLEWDDKLALIARKHSQDMAINNYF